MIVASSSISDQRKNNKYRRRTCSSPLPVKTFNSKWRIYKSDNDTRAVQRPDQAVKHSYCFLWLLLEDLSDLGRGRSSFRPALINIIVSCIINTIFLKSVVLRSVNTNI